MIKYINKSNLFLERFLIYIKENNNNINFPESLKESSFKDLFNYFNDINNIIKDARIEKEKHYQFLQYIFNHVTIGLIAFDKNYKVILNNQASQTLLNTKNINHLESLNKIIKGFDKLILNLKPGEQKTIPATIHKKNLQLSIKLSKFKLADKEVQLISLQDIKAELDHKEIESWQKLNRVLTHEIMNSVSPITGLTSNISKLLKNNNQKELPKDKLEQIKLSVNIIEERSKGLNNFVKKFRSITTQIKPEYQKINLQELVEGISIFMYQSFSESKINYSHNINPDNIEIYADKKLLEQVLINLLRNSIEALTGIKEKKIQVKGFLNESKRVILQVTDNGKGIPDEKIDLIFTPFYTSKEKGFGIGLSLSKNILTQHGFHIDTRSVPGKETVFTIYF